jgi:general secretion pathway protein K
VSIAKHSRLPAKQRGVALVTAILLVAIATGLATKLAWDNQLNLRRTESTLIQEQAKQIALGAEAVLAIELRDDPDWTIDQRLQPDQCFDNFGWASFYEPCFVPAQDVGIDEHVLGQAQLQLIEAQGKLNLNNLVRAGAGVVDADSKAKFEALFIELGYDAFLVDAIIDWIDSDTVPQGSGAEDGRYTGLDPAYRPANNFFTDVSELRSVIGFDPQTYNDLRKHVTAIPPGWCGAIPTPVNLNFATDAVIIALFANNSSRALDLIEDPYRGSWANLSELNLSQDDELDLAGLGTLRSDCFGLRVLVKIGSSTLTMYSLLDRAYAKQVITRVRTYGLDE